jgi:type IV secretion system protein VirB9
MHTHIQLGGDERLKEKPRLGETVQWKLTGNARNLYVKALRPDTTTSLTLVTDKRVYQFELRSTTKAEERIQKAVFNYPDDEEMQDILQSIDQAQVAAQVHEERLKNERVQQHAKQQELSPKPIDADSLSFYRVEAKEPYDKMHVYDNGVMTWIRMPRGAQDAPAVFEVSADGKLMPINYTWADRQNVRDPDVIVVERISKKWMLKLGKDIEIKIFRD